MFYAMGQQSQRNKQRKMRLPIHAWDEGLAKGFQDLNKNLKDGRQRSEALEGLTAEG